MKLTHGKASTHQEQLPRLHRKQEVPLGIRQESVYSHRYLSRVKLGSDAA